MEYACLPSEAPLETRENLKPPKDWPQHGDVKVENLRLKLIEPSTRDEYVR